MTHRVAQDSDSALRALTEARARVVGEDAVQPVYGWAPLLAAGWTAETDDDWAPLLEVGWTAETYRRLAVIADHATATHTLASEWDGEPEDIWPTLTRRAIVRYAERASLRHDAPAEQVLAWMVVYAAATDRDAHRILGKIIPLWNAGRPWRPDEVAVPIVQWVNSVGLLGPLAWAAGMPLNEATDRSVAGTLDPEGLRLLAALRGYRLPDFEVGQPSTP